MAPAMKVALVTSYMPPHLGGLERIAESLFTGYVRRGVETRWVASRIPADAPPREGQRIRVPCFNLAEDWLGVPVPVWGPRGWAEVARAVEWADAVHVLECLYLSSAMAAVLARRHGKPAVVSQNIGRVEYAFPPLNWIERAAYATLGRAVLRRASRVVLATPAAAALVAGLFPGGLAGVSTIPVGVDTAGFRPAAGGEQAAARAAIGVPPEGPLVLFAGRLVEKKGVAIVLDVARRLPGVRFVVAGDGPLRTLLGGAPANVAWHGAVGLERMPRYYHAADCVLLPSHGEGLPLVVQEAMACGRPVVVATDDLYAQELAAAGVCAAAARTAEAMAARVGEVLAGEDPALGRRARAHAEACWALDAMVARYVALLEGLL